MSKTSERRANMRDRLVDAAEAAIARGGIPAVKARDLAVAANCAVGAIYLVFPDLDAVILSANLRTLEAIDRAMSEAADTGPDDPVAHLERLGATYLAFAVGQRRRWRALFEHATPEGYQIPEWYSGRLEAVFRHVRTPLARLFPDHGDDEILEMAHALFAGVHGVVVLGLDGKLGAVPDAVVAARVRFLIRSVVAGAMRSG